MNQTINSIRMSAAAEAYVWGFPLVAVHRTRLLLCSKTATGVINHTDDLATPTDRAIVVPNNDTLYSSAWYDLRHGDLIIDVPAMDHSRRYWNVMILDGYTHVAYICRRHHGVAGSRVRVALDPSTPPSNDDSDMITLGTPTAWVIFRVLVESPDDLGMARALQRSISVLPPSLHPNEITQRAERATIIAQAGAEYFTELKNYIAIDPPAPWHPQLSPAAQAIVDDPASVSPQILAAGVDEGDKLMASRNVNGLVFENGWSTGRDATDCGDDIVKRAAGAKFGLGGHQAIENRSYIAQSDANGNRLDGNQALALHLPAKQMPPCNGFWSLTAYGTDMYLVANEIDRWSISNRTQGLHYDDDGGLTIIISAERPASIENWLPVPKGPYLMGMRVYEGHVSVVNCEWFPPSLVAVADALRRDS